MPKDIATVCLDGTATDDVTAALTEALAPFAHDVQPVDGRWQGEWDWWHVYGGDGERGLAVRPGHENDPRLIRSPIWLDGSPRPAQPAHRCDGGPRGVLDLDTERTAAAVAAAREWDTWSEFAARFPPAQPLQAKSERSPSGAPAIGLPYQEFREQPLMRALAAWRQSDPNVPAWAKHSDPVEYFGESREQYAHRAAVRAETTNVLVTLDGRWTDCFEYAPTPEQPNAAYAYFDFADRYLRELPDDAFIVRVRFHS
ncbi:hypothetical protein ACGF13_20060 [Kitasatospora sp. NPDC048286]|uniref:hypothetical protein n=1 Tax=Kitasatospora sp. NPDC048286 TaxID=3364047 RepID=UPI0037225842